MIGENIKRLLNEKGMTQRQLAINSACTESAISKYIGGQREPNFETLKRITKALGVKADELFNDNQNPKTTNFDRIAASAESLALTISNCVTSCEDCPAYENVCEGPSKSCPAKIRKWLQKEADDGI